MFLDIGAALVGPFDDDSLGPEVGEGTRDPFAVDQGEGGGELGPTGRRDGGGRPGRRGGGGRLGLLAGGKGQKGGSEDGQTGQGGGLLQVGSGTAALQGVDHDSFGQELGQDAGLGRAGRVEKI